MHCRNCSNEVSPQAIACPKCGVPPMKGKNYCHNCGSPTHEEAIICVNCGVGLKKVKSVDTVNFIESWSRFSYSNYILILLFSLMPFINLKCAGDKVESVTGLNMAVGAEREYLDTKTYYNIYGYEQERYVTKKESLFSWDICLFYITIIISLIVLLGSKTNKFKIARGWTIAALILLAEWFIVVSIRINKIAGRAIEISWGSGFWLTLILTIISLILLSVYLKRQRESEALSENIYPPQTIETETTKNIITTKQEPQVVNEIQSAAINHQPESLSDDVIFESSNSSKNRYIIVGLGTVIVVLGILYLLQREKSSSNSISQTDTLPITQNTDTVPNIRIQSQNNDKPVPIDNNISTSSEYNTYIVSNDRAYFYTSADENTRRNAYLVKNEIIQACCEQNKFVWSHFTNPQGKISEGWIRLQDLSIGDTRTTENTEEVNEKPVDANKLPDEKATDNSLDTKKEEVTSNNSNNTISTEEKIVNPTPVKEEVKEINASFPGGEQAMKKFLKQNIVFPSNFQRDIASRRFKFTVNEDGKISNPKFLLWDSFDPLNKEGLRVISKMPNWLPAIVNGRQSSSEVTITIEFNPNN